jgi:transposase InsO family protein
MGRWVEYDVRDDVVDLVGRWKGRFGLTDAFFTSRAGISAAKLSGWRGRYGTPNAHHGPGSRAHWLTGGERDAIVRFYLEHPEDGYRRCAYMMIDADVAFASPSAVYRALSDAGVMRGRGGKRGCKGKGFDQPGRVHEHWHTDISYVRVGERFFFLTCVLDGYSRYIVHWDLRDGMAAADVAVVQQRAVELHPEARPRLITDNGGQFKGNEFKKFIARHGLTHAATSPYYPQSNGKIERFHASLKGESLKGKALLDIGHAREVVAGYIGHYNHRRLHSAIGYVTPHDRMTGRDKAIHEARDAKMAAAAERRRTVFPDGLDSPPALGEGCQDGIRISAPKGPEQRGVMPDSGLTPEKRDVE